LYLSLQGFNSVHLQTGYPSRHPTKKMKIKAKFEKDCFGFVSIDGNMLKLYMPLRTIILKKYKYPEQEIAIKI